MPRNERACWKSDTKCEMTASHVIDTKVIMNFKLVLFAQLFILMGKALSFWLVSYT